MSFDVHAVEIPDGMLTLSNSDRVVIGRYRIATGVGGAAGVAVDTTVTGLNLPGDYSVFAMADQDAVVNIANKTNGGFVVGLLPRLATNTLAAGHVDLLIVA